MSNSYGSFQQPPQPSPGPQPQPPRRFDPAAKLFAWIRRSGIVRSDDRWIGGVCGGLARYFAISPVLMRAIMIAALLFGGFGAALYAFAWLLLPDGRDGGILGERLIAGDWDWACLGVILCALIGIGFPGAGLFAAAAAAFVLWLIIERELRRQRGYGGPGYGKPGYGGPQYNGPQYGGARGPAGQANRSAWPGPQSSPYPMQPPAGPTDGAYVNPAQGYDRSADRSAQQASDGTPSATSHDGHADAGHPYAVPSSLSPSASPMPQQPSPYGNASNTSNTGTASAPPFAAPQPTAATMPPMTSPYRAPQPKPAPVIARRKPAGPFVVAMTIGLASIFAAVALYLTDSYTLTSLTRSATLWIGATCVLIGLTILVLGIRGRRAGGLVPVAWIAGITAVCILAVNVTYTYVAARYAGAYRSHEVVDVHGYTDYDGTITYSANDNLDHDSAQFVHLSDGVVFDGANYDNDLVHIDLTDYARRPKHVATLHNGTTVRTNCPSGTIRLSASQTRVVITLPTGCPFAFGTDDLSMFGGNTYGGRYAVTIGTQGDGIDFGSSTFSQRSYMDGAARGNDGSSAIAALNDANGADAPGWLRDYDYYPSDNSELFIDTQYLLSAQVFVRYPTHAVGDNADLFGANTATEEQKNG